MLTLVGISCAVAEAPLQEFSHDFGRGDKLV